MPLLASSAQDISDPKCEVYAFIEQQAAPNNEGRRAGPRLKASTSTGKRLGFTLLRNLLNGMLTIVKESDQLCHQLYSHHHRF